MKRVARLKLQAGIQNLERVIQFVSSCASKQGFSRKKIMHIELASEEALVNIFHYAYPSKKGDVEIVCYPVTDDRFTIEIIDSGIPFNLLSAGEPVITSDLHKRKVGGLGIFLIRKVVDNIEYRREKDKNILTLTVLKD